MITLSNQGDLITICRDGFILLGARTPTALPGIIAQATPTTLTYDEAKEALHLLERTHPYLGRKCGDALFSIAEMESKGGGA